MTVFHEIWELFEEIVKCSLIAIIFAYIILMWYAARGGRKKATHPAIGCPPEEWNRRQRDSEHIGHRHH